MILPIRREEITLKTLPWVTFALMVVCLAVQIATPREDLEELPYLHATRAAAADYFHEHAYLEPHPEVIAEVGREILPTQRATSLDLIREDALRFAPEADIMAQQQRELDAITKRALNAPTGGVVENNVYRSFGLKLGELRTSAFLTHIAVHTGWLQLIPALLMLLLVGSLLEHRWGHTAFGVFGLTAAILGGSIYLLGGWMLELRELLPFVGTQAIVAGVSACILVLYLKEQVTFSYFWYDKEGWQDGSFEAMAWLVAPVWVGVELGQTIAAGSMGVLHPLVPVAHLCAALFGAGVAYCVQRFGLEEVDYVDLLKSLLSSGDPTSALERAKIQSRKGNFSRAVDILRAAVKKEPGNKPLLLALWAAAVECGRAEEAAAGYASVIRREARMGDVALATQYWRDLVHHVPLALVGPDSLLRMLPVLVEEKRPRHVVQACRQAVDSRNEGMTLGVAMRIVDEARNLDPPSALRAAKFALDSRHLEESKREQLKAIVADMVERGVECAEDWDNSIEIDVIPSWETDRAIELEPDPDEDLYPTRPVPGEGEATARARELGVDGELDESDNDGLLVSAEELESAGSYIPGLDVDEEARSEAFEDSTTVSELVDADDALAQPTPVSPLASLESAAAVPRSTAAEPKKQKKSKDLLPSLSVSNDLMAEIETVPESGAPDEEEPQSLDAFGDIAVDDAADESRFSDIKVLEAIPHELGAGALKLQVPNQGSKVLEYSKVEAIAVVAVKNPPKKPVVVIDLLLNWSEAEAEPLRSIRLTSDRFDPARLVPGSENAGQAFRQLVASLLERTGAVPLPDRASVLGEPFHVCENAAAYQREVLKVSGGRG